MIKNIIFSLALVFACSLNLNAGDDQCCDTCAVADITLHGASDEVMQAELKSFKDYLAKHESLLKSLEAKSMRLFIDIDLNANTSSNVSRVVEPYTAEDENIYWRQICVDKEQNCYVIRRYTSKEKSGLKKDGSCCKKVLVKFQCTDERKDKSLSQTFRHIAEIVDAAK